MLNLNHKNQLTSLCKEARIQILKMSTAAGSGHPTSSLSGVELMVSLLCNNFFQGDLIQNKLENRQNRQEKDRLIFSKGHASPLFYSMFYLLGHLTKEELLTFRQFDSALEGHPTPNFAGTELTTGSLGQGLGMGLGMSLIQQKDYQDNDQNTKYRTWVLLGDSEMTEGSVWEAIHTAAYYQVSNLVAILDLNGLGQTGPTQDGHDLQTFEQKFTAFGWETFVLEDGHNLEQINNTYQAVIESQNPKPKIILAKTLKGKGVSFLENQLDWHGKTLSEEQMKQAILEIQAIKTD